MTERERSQRRDDEAEDVIEDAPTNRGEDVAGKIDDLLDEIDSVLEENAEEFVKNYVQKGGE
jgi:ubiquitin-like protein Pup